MKRAFLKLSAAACAVLIAGPALASSPIELIVDYPFPELFRDVHTEIASEFMARNPNIKITFRAPTPGYEEATQQTLRQAVTKQLPDIAFHGLNRQRIFSDRDLAVDLQPFIRKEANWARMGYDQALLSLGQVGGRQTGLGFALSTPIVFVNNDLLKRAGVSLQGMTGSWDSVIAAARKVREASPGSNGIHVEWDITGNWMWQTLVFSNGGRMLSSDEKTVEFDSPAGQQAIRTLGRLVDEAGMKNLSPSNAVQDFASGNLAMLVTSTARLGQLNRMSAGKFEIKTAPMPIAANGRLPAGGKVAMMFTRDPQRQAAAWEYIKFATGPVGATIMVRRTGYFPGNNIPANDAAMLKTFYEQNPNHLTAIRQLPIMTAWYAFPGENGLKITEVMKDHLQTVVLREVAPTDVLKTMTRDVRALLPR